MNYDHAFHAGNFADVMKHVVLTRILIHLARKPAPFRIVDTHAGAGFYDLTGEAARRSGEWRAGIARLDRIDATSAAGVLLAPYRAVIEAQGGGGRQYPGSPVIAQAMMRDRDRGLFCETQASVRGRLVAALGRDARVKVLSLDGWTALGSVVPPPERRGLVLVDPPFEAADEFERMADAVSASWRKWRTGIYMMWYPVKTFAARDSFYAMLHDGRIENILRLELGIGPVRSDERLARCGLAVINPPYTLADEMRVVLPALSEALVDGTASDWSVAAA